VASGELTLAFCGVPASCLLDTEEDSSELRGAVAGMRTGCDIGSLIYPG